MGGRTRTNRALINILDPEFDFNAPEVLEAQARSWYAESPIGPLVLRYAESNALAEHLASAGECEFIEDFANPLPLAVMCELLGVPADDYDTFSVWSTDLGLVFSLALGDDTQGPPGDAGPRVRRGPTPLPRQRPGQSRTGGGPARPRHPAGAAGRHRSPDLAPTHGNPRSDRTTRTLLTPRRATVRRHPPSARR